MQRTSLCLVAALFVLSCAPAQNSAPNFSSGEHIILGDDGFKSACAERVELCSGPLMREDGKQSYTYGELVAFSGDFYETPDQIFFEKVKSPLAWNRNDIDDVKGKFKKEVETIENFLHGHSNEEYPDFNTDYAWNFPDYLTISLANAPHFGFYNMIAYVEYHSRALSMALEAHSKQDTQAGEARKLMTQALFVNAFADHYLTDGFAAGHIRDPRVQILNWGNTQDLSDRASGTLAKIIHDRDGEVRSSGEHGMNVTNSRGDQWLTRCDSQLFWQNNMQDPSIALPVRAVDASVREVLDAYEFGTVVSGVFSAAEYVPFPSAFERPLTKLFPKDMSEAEYDMIMQQMAFYTQIKAFSGVDKSVLKKLTAALPGIMEDFRRDVIIELGKNPRLMQRLPSAYREAYRQIQ